MRARLLIGAIVAVLGLTVAAGARAASLVYIQGGNVWLSDPDGGNRHQVTSDGTTATPAQSAYRSPTEAGNGTIFALKGGTIVHLAQNGTVIDSFAPDTGAYPLAAAVSPDATTVAYNYSELTTCTIPPFSCGVQPQPGSDVTPAGGQASNPASIQEGEQDGQWIGNTALVLQDDSSYIDYQAIGGAAQHWWAPNGIAYNVQPVVSRDQKYLLSVLRPTSSGGNPSASDMLQIFQVNGFPPSTDDPTLLCQLQALDAGGFQRPDIAPDDSGIVWYDNAGEEETAIPAGCTGGATFTLSAQGAFIPGATQASYGTAANAPAARPPTASSTSLSTASLKFKRSITRAALLKHGVTTMLTCNAACTYAAVLGVDNNLARKLGLTKRGRQSVLLGDARGKLAAGHKAVTIKLSSRARQALRRSDLKTLPLILGIAAKGTNGKRVDHTYRVTVSP
jgi:hypothetical protein